MRTYVLVVAIPLPHGGQNRGYVCMRLMKDVEIGFRSYNWNLNVEEYSKTCYISSHAMLAIGYFYYLLQPLLLNRDLHIYVL